MSKTPRMTLLNDGEFDAEQEALARSYKVDGDVVNVVRLFAKFKKFFSVYKRFGLYSMVHSSVPPRLRELAILRVAVLNKADYEWGHHSRMAHDVGLSWREIAAVRDGTDPGWTAADIAVLRAVDAIRHDANLNDADYAALAEHLDENQIFDLLITIGNYSLVSIVLNVARTPLEPGRLAIDDPLPSS